MEAEDLEWDPRTDDEILGEIGQRDPVCLRIANFGRRGLRVLKDLPAGPLLVWKLEHWGAATPFERLPASPGLDANSHTEELLSLGHTVVAYTFNEANRELLYDDVPCLRRSGIAILPVAQKRAPGGPRVDVRSGLGLTGAEFLFGCGGLLHPAKGIEEVAVGFLRTCRDPSVHLACSVIRHEADTTADSIRRRWEDIAGGVNSSRLHLRMGDYGEWTWMYWFYRSLDVMLVNSVSESWGRMASEAIGLGVPTLVRRAACATNHLAPEVVLADGSWDFAGEDLWGTVSTAQTRARALRIHVGRRYAPRVVRRRFLELVCASLDPRRASEVVRRSRDPLAVSVLDAMLDH
jgi:hypothetical protein